MTGYFKVVEWPCCLLVRFVRGGGGMRITDSWNLYPFSCEKLENAKRFQRIEELIVYIRPFVGKYLVARELIATTNDAQ